MCLIYGHARIGTVYDTVFFCNVRLANYNFACGSARVWNLVSDIKGGA
jgi:hypothetical protein